MAIEKIWKVGTRFLLLRGYSSYKHTNYKITEHRIPISKLTPNNYIAGKLWEHVEQDDKAEPILPLICVHGYMDNAGSFDTLIPLILKPNMRVLAFDLLGHGLSSHTASTFYEFYFDGFISLCRVLDHFHWKKATFLGHSAGANILFAFASLYPKYVDRFVALDNFRPLTGSTVEYSLTMLQKYFDVESKMARGGELPSYTWDEIVQKMYKGRNKSINLEECKLILERGTKKLASGKFQFSHDLRATIGTPYGRFSTEQSADFARLLQCPICVIKGEPGGDWEPSEDFMSHIDFVRQFTKRVEFHLVPGTHHFHLNNPELVAPIVNSFLIS